jgi:protocatechuate 3,4-dioxygenase beta subunit
MRVALSLLLVVLGAVIVSSQEDELIPAPYLAPQYTAPRDAPASVVMAGANEPGERLVVTGRVLDGAEPIAGASIFVFQTDAAGRYAPDKSGNDTELEPRLHGLLRTDRHGQYRYETIRPGSYDGNAAHVHYVVKAGGYKARLLDLWFEDDPILASRRAAGEPEIPPGIRNSAYYKASPDVVAIRPVARDASGVWRATRDIRVFKR